MWGVITEKVKRTRLRIFACNRRRRNRKGVDKRHYGAGDKGEHRRGKWGSNRRWTDGISISP